MPEAPPPRPVLRRALTWPGAERWEGDHSCVEIRAGITPAERRALAQAALAGTDWRIVLKEDA